MLERRVSLHIFPEHFTFSKQNLKQILIFWNFLRFCFGKCNLESVTSELDSELLPTLRKNNFKRASCMLLVVDHQDRAGPAIFRKKIQKFFQKNWNNSENLRKFQKIVQSVKLKTSKNLMLSRFLPLVRFRLRGWTSKKSSLVSVVTDNLEFQIFDKDLCGRKWERGRDKVSGQGCTSGLWASVT